MAINGPSTELQRMAALTGLTYYDKASGLSLHPKYGSWFALRAVLVFGGVEHTGKPSFHFLQCNASYRQGCNNTIWHFCVTII